MTQNAKARPSEPQFSTRSFVRSCGIRRHGSCCGGSGFLRCGLLRLRCGLLSSSRRLRCRLLRRAGSSSASGRGLFSRRRLLSGRPFLRDRRLLCGRLRLCLGGRLARVPVGLVGENSRPEGVVVVAESAGAAGGNKAQPTSMSCDVDAQQQSQHCARFRAYAAQCLSLSSSRFACPCAPVRSLLPDASFGQSHHSLHFGPMISVSSLSLALPSLTSPRTKITLRTVLGSITGLHTFHRPANRRPGLYTIA